MAYETPEALIARASHHEIEQLTATSLVESGIPGELTRKYRVEGHPGLFVREYPRDDRGFHELGNAYQAARAMARYNISVPPSRPHYDERGNYMISVYIQGESLDTLLKIAPSEDLISQTDEHFARLGTWLSEETKAGRRTVMDVYSAEQYMKGFAGTHPTEAIWLADLPIYPSGPEDYIFNLHHLTDGILQVEKVIGKQLPKSWSTLIGATILAPEITNDEEGMIVKIHHSLDTGISPLSDEWE